MEASWAQRFTAADLDLTDVYEKVMVPRLFTPWAELLADALAPAPGATVVDVATGPGTVARVLADRVGLTGRVIGCDISAGMLSAASRHPAGPGAAPIRYLECPADMLPLADDEADGVTCQHGLQFFPDRVAALVEMRRVTRPGGHLAMAVWGPLELSTAFAALAAGAAAVLGQEAADAYRGGPFSIADPAALADLGVAASWQDVVVAPHSLSVDFDGGPAQLVATPSVTPLGTRVAALDDAGRRALVDAVADALGPQLGDEGVIHSSTSAHFMLATA